MRESKSGACRGRVDFTTPGLAGTYDAPQVKAILFDGDDDSDDNGPGKPSGAS